MAKSVSLDVDPTIIEKNLLLNELESCELDSLFPKPEEKSKLIKPLPVVNQISGENKLDIKETTNDPDKDNIAIIVDNIIDNLDAKKEVDSKENKKVLTEDNDQSAAIIQIKEDNSTKLIISNLSGKNTNQLEENCQDVETNLDDNGTKLSNIDKSITSELNAGENKSQQLESSNTDQPELTGEDVLIISDNSFESKELNEIKSPLTTTNKSVESTELDRKEDSHQSAEEVEIETASLYENEDYLLLRDNTNEEEPKVESKSPSNDDKIAKEEDEIQNYPVEKNVDNSQKTLGRCLWVSGLSHTTRANDLKQHFVNQGRVIGAKIVSNSRLPNAKCYGYIVMSTPEEAENCVKNLHHSTLSNKMISVQKAKSDKHTIELRVTTSETVTQKQDDIVEFKDDKLNDIKKKEDESEKDRKKSETKDDIKYSRKKRNSKERNNAPRREEKFKHLTKRNLADERDKRIREERYQRIREERERRERMNKEQKRLREQQRRQREEAERLDRERLQLKLERERLQREKMELLRLEKEQLEKEKEELRRQKQKIEEARRKKRESKSSERRFKRHRDRSPIRRRTPEIPSKIVKKSSEKETSRISSKYKINEKYKDPSKESYRISAFERHRTEYDNRSPGKYEHFHLEKKLNRRDTDSKINEKQSIKREEQSFEPPPPCITPSESSHFNILPISHSSYGGTGNSRIRNDFHPSKDGFVTAFNSSRGVEDRFPVGHHGTHLPEENLDISSHRPNVSDCFPKQDMLRSVRRDQQRNAAVIDNSRIIRGERHMDSFAMSSTLNRYHEPEKEIHRRDPWYLESGGGIQTGKRPMPMPERRDYRDVWPRNNNNDNVAWNSSRRYGVYPPIVDRDNKMNRF